MNYLKIFISFVLFLLVFVSFISYREIEGETLGSIWTENNLSTCWSCEWINSTPVEDTVSEIISWYESKPFLTWAWTWYNYDLNITNGSWRSKRHDTCAMRVWTRYNYYRVCLRDTDKCIVCKLNDYWPKEYTYKVIDLSSHAFQQLAPLSRGVIAVDIYEIWPEY